MNEHELHILNLYPDEMNIYGDTGNVLTLMRRIEWHGYTPKLSHLRIGDPVPDDVDIIIGGGGQDSGQGLIQHDLQRISGDLTKLADDNVSMLVICGLYQLFGRFFALADGSRIPGIGIFGTETYAGPTRLIGNVVATSPFGDLIGYENHSGLTVLDDDQEPLGHIVRGKGNNGDDRTEGAITKNVIGSYLHGSLLPKNPRLADHIIETACRRKFGSFNTASIDDRIAEHARAIARKRPR